MCRPTDNNNSIESAPSTDNKSLRRTRQSDDAAVVGVDGSQTSETTRSLTNSQSAITFFYAKLNDVDSEETEHSNRCSGKRRRVVRAKRRAQRNARPFRPDASGRINNKECHLLAFGAWLEEELE